MITIHASSVWVLLVVAFLVGTVIGSLLRRRKSTASVTHSIGTLSVKLEVDSADAEAKLAEIIEELSTIHQLLPLLLEVPVDGMTDDEREARGELA